MAQEKKTDGKRPHARKDRQRVDHPPVGLVTPETDPDAGAKNGIGLSAGNLFEKITRRDVMRLARTFGYTATLLAAAASGGVLTLSTLARAAESEREKRNAKPARVRLVYGSALLSRDEELINPVGCAHFIRDIEERTDGEIRVDLIDLNEICQQEDCARKAQEGIVDLYSATTQNSVDSAPYFHVLDFPYLFQSRAAQNYFFYHPESERLLREPLRKHHGIRILFTGCHLRSVCLGPAWRVRPSVGGIEELAGLKIRVCNSKLGRIALDLLGITPVPIAWIDTPGAIKHGMVDGLESTETAVASTMPEAVSQVVDLRLFSANWLTAITETVFAKLTQDLQNALMESAYQTQVFVHLASEAALVNTVGASDPPAPQTIFARHGIRFVLLPQSELLKAEHLCAPEFNPKPWEQWREKLNRMAGDIDIYQEIKAVAREIAPDTLAEDVEPRRWWKDTSRSDP